MRRENETATDVGSEAPDVSGYRILKDVRSGGTSRVYKAERLSDGKHVALKIPENRGENASLFRDLLLNEDRILKRLKHSSIVAYGDFTETITGAPVIVMDWIDGIPLKELIASGCLNHANRIAIVEQLGEALSYLHEAGFIHADLKPSNVLVAEDGSVKLIDFGLARSIPGATLEDDHIRQNEAGKIYLGSLNHGAPEVFSDELPFDARADVYGFATLIHELFTGELPGSIFLPIDQRLPEIPPLFRPTMAKALEYDPADRIPSIARLLNLLTRNRGTRVLYSKSLAIEGSRNLEINPTQLLSIPPISRSAFGEAAPLAV